MNPMLLADFYKISHRKMYPPGTTKVYSTWTPRGSRMAGVNEFVWFGLQAFIERRLVNMFQTEFFESDIEEIIWDYERMIRGTLGDKEPETDHIRALHDLGFLPLRIRGLDEGTVVPLRTPVMTIENTADEFFWLTNYIETLMSCELWQASTSATIARQYRQMFEHFAFNTGGDTDFAKFQGHDFSMRGMGTLDAAVLSGMGHLTSFVGTDTIPAIIGAEDWYEAHGLVGTSVPATEHSIQCAWANDAEYFRDVIQRAHPTGIVSIVADGYDFWKVITDVLPNMKDEIMGRNGKLVVRPDSGDPVKIICGDPYAKDPAVYKGAVECLWDTFGGTTNELGYKMLDSHIGLIYGDAITLERANRILAILKDKGFASTNIVLGIGSFTYQYQTRDTFSLALKSTLIVRNGEEIPIFKSPKTDDGTKYSQRGRVVVERVGGQLRWRDGLRLNDHVPTNLLKDRFVDGRSLNFTTFAEVRERINDAD